MPPVMLGAIFGKVIGDSGVSVGIVSNLLKIVGEKNVVLVIVLYGTVLSHCGIGTFIIAFSVYTIAVALFQKADLSKKLIVATIMVCPVTVCMAMLPGFPATQNLIPTAYFGTTSYAGAKIGIICSIIMFACAYIYLNHQVRRAHTNGGDFVVAAGEDIMDLNEVDAASLPEVWKCSAPIVVLIIFMFALQSITSITVNYAAACAMTLAVIVACFSLS